MAVKTNLYATNKLNTQDLSRGPSSSIWLDFPAADEQSAGDGFTPVMHVFDDFLDCANLSTLNAIGQFGKWATWADTNAVLGTDPQQEGGVILLSDGGNSTVNITLGSGAGWARLISPASGYPYGQKVWFEARVAVGSITTAKRDVFIGLADNTNFVTASAAKVINTTNILATVNGLLGFHFRSTTNPTDVGVAYNVAGGTVQYPTNLQTLSNTVAGAALTAEAAGASGAQANGFIKLGFVFDPTPALPAQFITSASTGQTVGTLARPILTFYVNGQAAPAFLTSTNLQAATFPTGYMAPVISYTSRSGTAAGGLYVDWIRCGTIGTY